MIRYYLCPLDFRVGADAEGMFVPRVAQYAVRWSIAAPPHDHARGVPAKTWALAGVAADLDTHKLTSYSVAPWPVPTEGWEMQMVFPAGDKLLVIRPTSSPYTPRHAALFDPATKAWASIDPGEGWGNSGFMHSSGKLILMGGGINGEAEANKQVWVGTLQ